MSYKVSSITYLNDIYEDFKNPSVSLRDSSKSSSSVPQLKYKKRKKSNKKRKKSNKKRKKSNKKLDTDKLSKKIKKFMKKMN